MSSGAKSGVGGDTGVERLMERLRTGDVRALARAVSLVEDGDAIAAPLVAACKAAGRRALRIGITGPPGAGKSTLVDRIAQLVQESGQHVGVIAVDPSSPYTGGALLGDRIRMQSGTSLQAGVFIRSMASRGVMGGLARGVEAVCTVMEAAGRETILIETVGVGQDEVDVVGVADVTVLVLVPGMGDEVQSLKAGVMEIADVFVINKADREGAERLEADLATMQGLAGASERAPVPVVRTVAVTGAGVAELMEQVRRVAAEKKRRPMLKFAVEGLGSEAVLDRPILDQPVPVHPVPVHPVPDQPVLDHLGVAVRSLAIARGFYEALGLVVGPEETVEREQVRVAMLGLGESRIELLEATVEDSVIGRFVAKRGEGLHHVAIRVADVDGVFARLQGDGTKLASDAVRVGASGHRYFFVHPASTGGVLVEIVGSAAAQSGPESRQGGQ